MYIIDIHMCIYIYMCMYTYKEINLESATILLITKSNRFNLLKIAVHTYVTIARNTPVVRVCDQEHFSNRLHCLSHHDSTFVTDFWRAWIYFLSAIFARAILMRVISKKFFSGGFHFLQMWTTAPHSLATTEEFVEILMGTTAVSVPLHTWESSASYVCSQTNPLWWLTHFFFKSVKPFQSSIFWN